MPSKKNAYSEFTKGWSEKRCGPKPTAEELATAEALGFRPGSKVAFANAMYLREGGATGEQVEAAVGKPQLNGRRQLVNTGLAKKGGEVRDPETNRKVYKTELTVRGQKLVAKNLGEEAPAKEAPVKNEQPHEPVVENQPQELAADSIG